MRALLLSVGLVAMISAPACDILNSDDDDNDLLGTPIPYEAVDLDGLHVVEPLSVVVESQEAWDEFWNDHNVLDDPPPVLDFSGKVVAALFWSPRAGCPQEIDVIEGVFYWDRLIEVQVGPLPDLGDCEAIVYPSQAIQFATNGELVLFGGQRPD